VTCVGEDNASIDRIVDIVTDALTHRSTIAHFHAHAPDTLVTSGAATSAGWGVAL
jgi:hypothetical protein